MDRKEKNALKATISQFINLGNGRFKDSEVEELMSIVSNRDEYDGQSRTYRNSYKSFDSEDTYHVDETDTFTFHSDDAGIHIDEDYSRHWDDGQLDESHRTFDTARDILKLFRKTK